MQKRIVFFGSGYYVIPVVAALKDFGLELVITTEPEGEFVNYLKKEKINFIYSKLKDQKDFETIQISKPDIGVLASFGAIIPQQVINLFPKGILNIHPSLLPKYKGPSPVQYAILNGERETGVSIIKLDDQVDHGPIITQKTFKLTGLENTKNLTELLFVMGANMIQEVILKVSDGLTLEEIPQSRIDESWTRKIEKAEGEVFLSHPIKPFDLEHKIRAFYPWPGVYLTVSLFGKHKILKLLPDNMYQVEGKHVMSYKDFLNGYGTDAAAILATLGR